MDQMKSSVDMLEVFFCFVRFLLCLRTSTAAIYQTASMMHGQKFFFFLILENSECCHELDSLRPVNSAIDYMARTMYSYQFSLVLFRFLLYQDWQCCQKLDGGFDAQVRSLLFIQISISLLDKKYVKEKEREQHLPGYCPQYLTYWKQIV